jgi:hypothetical protein
MPEKDNSRSLEDHSGWKTTGHDEGVGRWTVFNAVLSPQSLFFPTRFKSLCYRTN